ncbi:ATP-binding protein [Spirosoma sp.]|uniref:ATP-binding protein n=1 Tax=Spirosoma sp. TaxID=1899569 RepID=UPI00262FCA5F|nr:ATP-binding protein [Spirosoma sp.]MCX6214223.1 ATP-binding protein [Spirosoma sp.]
MNTEWLKLRLYDGDLRKAFEEMVCQLAEYEPIENRVQFIRVAAPDGGKEAYWILNNGDEYGWQAKFFTSMDKGQWKQLNESVEKVLDKHPRLTRYYICTPLDREDPRIENQRWFMDKWIEWVGKWQKLARKMGRTVEFIYWGNYELFERLSRPVNVGRLNFWFQETELTEEWFTHRLEEGIHNLGSRYTPEVDFQLPVVKVFNGLARNNSFLTRWSEEFNQLKTVAYKAIHQLNVQDKDLNEQVDRFKELLSRLNLFEEANRPNRLSIVDQGAFSNMLKQLVANVDQIISRFYELNRIEVEKKKTTGQRDSEYSNAFGWDIERCREVNRNLYEYIGYINGLEVKAANVPAMVLSGDAGMGKSHLLADIAQKRKEENLPTVLLLGQQFTTTDEPWTQILRLLHLSCNRDIFLATLNTYGETLGSRVLLIIDAINEGQGRFIWEHSIRGFLHEVAHYPWLGLVISVRSSYEELLLPESIAKDNRLLRVVHHGFKAVEYQATKRFFEYYGLLLPSIPLLHPEFSNPLFLHLFCKGLKKKGLNRIPDGYEGITAIITFLIDAIDEVLAKKLHYPTSLRLTQKIVDQLAAKLLEQEARSISFEETFYWLIDLPKLKAISEPRRGQYIEDLISEGILSKNFLQRWDQKTQQLKGEEILFFTYERFGDHLMVSHLIDNYVNKVKPKESFEQDTKLQLLISGDNAIHKNEGLVEAMAIQLPEKIGIELHQVLPQFANTGSVAGAFIESLLWRKLTSFTDETKKYLISIADTDQEYWFNRLFQNLLLVTASPSHPFNSDFLHQSLMKLTMVDRDAWWSKYIHFKYSHSPEEPTAVQRLIDWAWSVVSKQNIEAEAARLMGQTIAWFLTSSNRLLRDSATKALVSLFENRILILIQVLQAFEEINDPYVYERLWAVVYGCTLRTKQKEFLKPLSEYTYQCIFNQEEVYPHILLRDYARQVIEYTSYLGLVTELDLIKIRPPYKSQMPKRFPTNKEIDKKYKLDYKSSEFKKHQWSQNNILKSMTTEYGRGVGGYGDFGRYVFENNFDGWREEVNVNRLSNLAVQWIFKKYGYDVEKLGEFEQYIGRFKTDRHDVQSERIGKKYQWIAMHELLARVSDNFTLRDSWGEHEEEPFEGPWNPFVRDIDPSILIKKTAVAKGKTSWWNPAQSFDWSIPHKDWIAFHDDFPDPRKLIHFINPVDGEEWLSLESHPSWQEPTFAHEDEYQISKKNLWYQIRAYIVPEEGYNEFIEWGGNQDFFGKWMPESWDRREVFSREFYWSPAYKALAARAQKDESIEEPWRRISIRYSHQNSGIENLGPVMVPTQSYIWSEQYDASKEETISFHMPNGFLFEKMKLQYADMEGAFVNADNQIVCFDPSVEKEGDSCLLIRKADLFKMLNEQGLRIFWTVLGQKSIHHMHNAEKYSQTVISGIVHFQEQQLQFDHIIYDATEQYLKKEAEQANARDWKEGDINPFIFDFGEEE